MKIKVSFLFLLIGLFFHVNAFASECVFGEEIVSLVENKVSGLHVRKLGYQVKLDRIALPIAEAGDNESQVLRVQVVEIKMLGHEKIYHLNYTDEDQFDGGNSFGWIENLETLEVVAVVQDSQILKCTVMQ